MKHYAVLPAAALLLAASAMPCFAGAPERPASVSEVIATRRSVRRFTGQKIDREQLTGIARAGALASTAGNRQPWEFIIIDEPDRVEKVFPLLGWLGGPPPQDSRPTAYIALLVEKRVMDSWAHIASAGAALQNIQLAAWGKGIGSCCFGTVDREKAVPLLDIPGHLHLFVVIALGYPAETPVVEEADESLRPYRGGDGVLRVPKKPLGDILHFGSYGAGKEGG